MNAIKPISFHRPAPVVPTLTYPPSGEKTWQQLYHNELWLRTVYTYRTLRARQVVSELDERHLDQLRRIESVVLDKAVADRPVERQFGCQSVARLLVPSVNDVELEVELQGFSIAGATISKGPIGVEHRSVTLIVQLQVSAEGDLRFPARISGDRDDQLELTFIGAPYRSHRG